MKLHRVSSQPDWQTIPAADQNGWQVVAGRTAGIITPANIITLLGVLLTSYGLLLIYNESYWSGLILACVGRFCDILDGLAADKTGTKSPLGEFLDATVDKVISLAAIIVFAAAGIAPWWMFVSFVVPQAVISLIAFIAKQTDVGLHPSRVGKLSMAGIWLCMAGLVLAAALDRAGVLTTLLYAIAVLSTIGSCYSAVDYYQQLKQTTR